MASLPILRGIGEDVIEAALEQFAGVGEVALNVGLGFVNGGKRLVQNLHNPFLLLEGWDGTWNCEIKCLLHALHSRTILRNYPRAID